MFLCNLLGDPGNGNGQQRMTRTLPVSWCVSGGTDTHRRHPVAQSLHDDLLSKGTELARMSKVISFKSHQKRVEDNNAIESNCKHIFKSGSTVIGRYSHDIVKHRKQGRDASTSSLKSIVKSEEQGGMKMSEMLEEDNLDDLFGEAELLDGIQAKATPNPV